MEAASERSDAVVLLPPSIEDDGVKSDPTNQNAARSNQFEAAVAALCDLLTPAPDGPAAPPDVPMGLSALLALPAFGVDTSQPIGHRIDVSDDGRTVAVAVLKFAHSCSTAFLLIEPAQSRRVQRIVMLATGNSSSTIGMVEDPAAISVGNVLYRETNFAAGGAGMSPHYTSHWPGQTAKDLNYYFQGTVTLTLDRWLGHLVIDNPTGIVAAGRKQPLHVTGFGREAALAVCVFPGGQFECVSSEWVSRDAVAPLFAPPGGNETPGEPLNLECHT